MTDIEQVVCKVSDLQEGEFKEFQLGDDPARKILLIKSGGKFYATGNKCTHYGAPLKNGSLCQGKIRCPWHGACFNIGTGDIEDHPGLDSIYSFQVEIRGEDVVVLAPSSAFGGINYKRTKPMTVRNEEQDKRLFLLIGGGAASTTCAEVLREEGFQGRIVIVTNENHYSYDRPKLSKAMDVNAELIALRTPEFYDKSNIEWKLGCEVIELDVEKKFAKLNNGEQIKYDSAFVATGGIPRTLPLKGKDLSNIFTLRFADDAKKIYKSAEGKNVVIVGSSFIGMEAAACLVSKAKSCTVIGMETYPFERVLGKEIGSTLMKLHESKGVQFKMNRTTKEFVGSTHLEAVILDNGEKIDADVAILGVGVVPATSFIKNGVTFEKDKSIRADEYLKAGDSLFVGGDICTYPDVVSKTVTRIEHWGLAHIHGRIAAMNMLGKSAKMDRVPYFWTAQYGKSLRYCGHAKGYDEIIFDGDLNQLQFVVFYVKDGRVVASASMNKDPVVSCVAQLLGANAMPDLDTIRKGQIDWVKIAAAIN